MDPNANLREQEDLLTMHHTTRLMDKDDRERLFELREALEGWLDRGGFHPDWSAAPNARLYFPEAHGK